METERLHAEAFSPPDKPGNPFSLAAGALHPTQGAPLSHPSIQDRKFNHDSNTPFVGLLTIEIRRTMTL
jgi:hypothetical protein